MVNTIKKSSKFPRESVDNKTIQVYIKFSGRHLADKEVRRLGKKKPRAKRGKRKPLTISQKITIAHLIFEFVKWLVEIFC